MLLSINKCTCLFNMWAKENTKGWKIKRKISGEYTFSSPPLYYKVGGSSLCFPTNTISKFILRYWYSAMLQTVKTCDTQGIRVMTLKKGKVGFFFGMAQTVKVCLQPQQEQEIFKNWPWLLRTSTSCNFPTSGGQKQLLCLETNLASGGGRRLGSHLLLKEGPKLPVN